jgi:hypothetical protein
MNLYTYRVRRRTGNPSVAPDGYAAGVGSSGTIVPLM